MIAMTISNSTNVNAREALIEYALRRKRIFCHKILIFAKLFFGDSACPERIPILVRVPI
jgi:hypothetical protein